MHSARRRPFAAPVFIIIIESLSVHYNTVGPAGPHVRACQPRRALRSRTPTTILYPGLRHL